MSQMLGIDTSHWKGDIDLANVRADFVWTKATEGNYYIDDVCDKIVQQAISLNKKWGVYHFGTNLITGPETEADYFVDNCEGYIGKGILVLDNENYYWSDGTHAHDPYNVGWALAWLNHVFARTGVKPLIYMSLAVVNGADWSPVINAGYGLIVAAYVDNYVPIPNYQMDFNRDPNPRWDGVVGNVMWQFTSTGRLDGYSGNLDCNVFYGDGTTWNNYAVAKPVTIPVPSVPEPPTPQPTPEPTTTPTPDPVPIPTPIPMPDTGPIINDPLPPLPPLPRPKPIPASLKKSTSPVIEKTLAQMLGKYNKFFVAIAGLFVTFLLQHYGSNPIIKDVVMALTAAGVYQAKNEL